MIKVKGRERKILVYLADIFEKEQKKPWVHREKIGEHIGAKEDIFDIIESIFVLNILGLVIYNPRDRHKVMISQEGLKYVIKHKLRRKSKRIFSLRNLLTLQKIFIAVGLIGAIITA